MLIPNQLLDRSFVPGDNAIIIAWGESDVKTLKYHGSNRLATVLCFWDCPLERITPIPNTLTLTAFMPNIVIPADETTYMCYSMPFATPKVSFKLDTKVLIYFILLN